MPGPVSAHHINHRCMALSSLICARARRFSTCVSQSYAKQLAPIGSAEWAESPVRTVEPRLQFIWQNTDASKQATRWRSLARTPNRFALLFAGAPLKFLSDCKLQSGSNRMHSSLSSETSKTTTPSAPECRRRECRFIYSTHGG